MFKKVFHILFALAFIQLMYGQDPPLGFEFNQGTEQGFYFFQDITIDGAPLDPDDWIGAFKKYDESQGGECSNNEINFDETLGGMCSSSAEGFSCTPGFPDCDATLCNETIDVDNDGSLSVCACPDLNNDGLLASQNLDLCIGSRRYGDCLDSRNCDIPVLGYDGYCYSGGYIENGETPYFKIYDSSIGEVDAYYYAFPSEEIPWSPFIFVNIESLAVTYDCSETLGGNAILDDCGVCCSGNTGVDCSYYNGVDDFGGQFDCSGECYGDLIVDVCGYCVSVGEECDEDCAGILDGDAYLDDCGICICDTTGGDCENVAQNSIEDCLAGDWESSPNLDCNCDCYGTAFLDYCEECSEGLTSHIANSDIDCTGYDNNGNIIIDNDGNPVEGSCFGEATLLEYCYDGDGDDLGEIDSETFYCNEIVPDSWVFDCSDTDDDCFENWWDCTGTCAGNAQEIIYCFDQDGDGFGNPGSETEFCDALVEQNWVEDCSDLNDDIFCENNIYDECFTCDPCGDGTSDCQDWGIDCNQPLAYNNEYSIDEDDFISILL